MACPVDALVEVASDTVAYGPSKILASSTYSTTSVSVEKRADGRTVAKAVPLHRQFLITTQRKVPKVGVMIVGLGGNNGTTVTAGILANQLGLTWRTKTGKHSADYLGSITQASTVRLGVGADGGDVYVPMSSVVPMVHPNDLEIGGWDISSMNLGDAMERAAVLDYDLQRQLYPHMAKMTPLPSVYVPDFIAANQGDRADNLVPEKDMAGQLAHLRADIRAFKAERGVDKVIVLWSANTERFADVLPGVNDTPDAVLASIEAGHSEIAPSTLFAVASILEGCTYINGSPQNTFVPGVMALAEQHGVFIGGDDFKSGQTKMKSVLVDFLVSSGIKPESIVSYNHLGNNDGKNLSAPKQFRSKEISKSNVVDDMVASNRLMYAEGEHPDHCVVIKYVPHVGDSKRALDEYTSRIFMGGTNTIAMHNTCEDSLLAAPLIIDLVVIAELCERIRLRETTPAEAAKAMAEAAATAVAPDAEAEAAATLGEEDGERFHSVLSLLSFLLKAPLVPSGTPVINALFRQREALCNVLRACVGLPPENHMSLEHRLASAGTAAREWAAAHADVGSRVDASSSPVMGGAGSDSDADPAGDATKASSGAAKASDVKPVVLADAMAAKAKADREVLATAAASTTAARRERAGSITA